MNVVQISVEGPNLGSGVCIGGLGKITDLVDYWESVGRSAAASQRCEDARIVTTYGWTSTDSSCQVRESI